MSCKDYDDDIDEINGKIDKIETTLSELESKIGDKAVGSRSDPQPTPTGPVGFQLLNDISGENGIIPDKK